MAKQSLFSACKRVFRDGISGTYTVGNNDIFLELYSQQDIDQNNEIGNSSEENIVVVAGDTITIPEGYTLTPVKPKKSLVIICNTFVNNGTISMYQKAPNVLPHDLFIVEKQEFGGGRSAQTIIIPAYANNEASRQAGNSNKINGINGTDRQCGSGGIGSASAIYQPAKSGSGYAFGGGAGSGSMNGGNNYSGSYVDSTYPMRGANGQNLNSGESLYQGGVGNPPGISYGNYASTQTFGCGGRIIIYCNSFTNNGTINVNGSSTKVMGGKTQEESSRGISFGGASGAGAVDIFYTDLYLQGTITANGGTGLSKAGNGGNGSITLTPWLKTFILKPISKYMSKENMVYFLTNYIQRLKQGED